MHKHSDHTKLKYTQLKTGSKCLGDLEWMEQEAWQVYSFGKRNVFRLGLNESREGFCWRGRGRSFHVDGPTSKPNKQKKHRQANLFFPLAC